MADEEKLRDCLKAVTAELRHARERVRELETAGREPIAIVAMACRFPGGVSTPGQLWELVRADARGRDRSGSPDAAGFLCGAADFDADFFGISPGEALAMDPPHRLVLETSWEAFERAGIDPATLRGSSTGVFVGTSGQDRDSGHLAGATGSGLSGRVSGIFGLEGPAVTVDTACSSSLVALHWAGQSLRAGECDLALAGGAGWAEGAGMVLVERRSDAVRNGHPILALLRGSAVNQNGLADPNGPARQRVIRAALAKAGLDPFDVDVVEAHGTGPVPAEARAPLVTCGPRADEPLRQEPVRPGAGQPQPAAGVAGVIKMVEAMRNEALPRILHSDQRGPGSGWAADIAAKEWPRSDRPRRAAVSSFGLSGANVHVVVEEVPAATKPRAASEDDTLLYPLPWLVSARTEPALRAQAERLRAWLAAEPGTSPADVGFSLATTRAAHEHRAVIVGGDRDELVDGLTALARGEADLGLIQGTATGAGRGVVFVFPGQDVQWAGMAVELLDCAPAFTEQLAECAAALSGCVDWSLLDVVRGAEGAPSLERVDVVQPVLWAVMVSLAELWRSHGVEPAAVVGHAHGEIAAACVAGALSIADGAKVVALRSQALAALSGTGGMASVAAPAAEVSRWLEPWGERLSLAAVNGPESTVVSGQPEALEEFLAACRERAVRIREAEVDYAAHAPQVEAIRSQLAQALAGIRPARAAVPMCSTLTGGLVRGPELGARYWYDNLRGQVRFAPAIQSLADAGHHVFVEVSPHPVLIPGIEDLLRDAGVAGKVVGTLRRDHSDRQRFLSAAAELHVNGVRVHWPAVFDNRCVSRVELPTYAFQRRRFRLDGWRGAGHPLLGAALPLAGTNGVLLTGRLSARTHPWLTEHAIGDTVLLPGAALVELALRAGDEADCPVLAELTLEAPLVLPAEGTVELQVSVGGPEEGGRGVEIHSRADGPAWTRHAVGLVSDRPAEPGPEAPAWPPENAEPVDVAAAYSALADAGFGYGPLFQGLRSVWRRDGEVFAETALPQDALADAACFGVHPALLDSALHALPSGRPCAWRDVTLHTTGATALRVRLRPNDSGGLDLTAWDESGAPVLSAGSLALRPAVPGQAGPAEALPMFRTSWHAVPVRPSATGVVWSDVDSVGELCASGEIPPTVAVDVTGERLGVVLELLHTWLSAETDARLVVVTRGAALDAAPGRGLVRAAQAEHPGRFALADLDDLDALVLQPESDEPQLTVRDGEYLVPRLERACTATARPVDFAEDGTVLITGAGSPPGALVAGHLVRAHGVRRLLLLDAPSTAAEELSALGADVRQATCDLADRAALSAVLNDIPRLTGIVHAAGVPDDSTVASLTPERLDDALKDQALGAWQLHELTRDLDLSAFVLFSSATGILGTGGQAVRTAANACLDAVAHRRRAAGLRATSLAWGPLRGDGLFRNGIRSLRAEQVLELFDAALASADAALVAVRFDLLALREEPGPAGVPSLLRSLVPAPCR
ncbi:acyltransferase domain-containing protein [Amycolatopsis sp. FU40]|uniref:Polyketide synthase type I n=1 Tax=Amycolatopsis sp. FU40 TaxID=2914159 RepID=G4XIL8_9PSEU|nr:type I polyketide synthase [Amycolatopsis sp. FU40]AEP40925.1 polyketide synthase type I [Amycolatopsis sp. FU40]UKD51731.1 acyltransferase domain-containing protein [Amycolatopsis sp. FU40]